jgi:hypothetical protein
MVARFRRGTVSVAQDRCAKIVCTLGRLVSERLTELVAG